MIDSYTNWNYSKFQFDKILNDLSFYALSLEAKNRILTSKVITDFDIIEKKYSILKELIDYIKYEEDKIDILNIFDIKEYLLEAEKGSILDARKIYRISYNINSYFILERKFNKEKFNNLKNIFSVKNISDKFYKEVLKYFDYDGNIDSNISKELKEIRDEIILLESKIKLGINEFYNNAKKNDYTVDNLISVRDGLPCVGIKVSAKNKINGIVVDYSSTGQTIFVVPSKVIELNNDMIIAKEREGEEIRRILKGYTEIIKSNLDSLKCIAEELIEFDIFFAKAKFGIENDLNIPVLSKERILKIDEGRHPLLGESAVPVTVEIGRDFNILIITGPNTGGKTVLLKTIGLFVLMNQNCIGIKARENSIFYVFENMFVDIGDEQSIEASLSTFSGHIKNIIDIINNMNENSLILIDELGTGTDPVEGEALAVSIIEKISSKNSFAVITTHFNALKMLPAKNKSLQNGAMEFDSINLMPTYRLITGIPGRSYALEISERLGLSKDIIESAKSLIDKRFLDIDTLLKEIMLQKKNYEEKLIDLENKIRDFEEEKKRFLVLEKELKEREKELKRIIKDQKYDFLIEARKEFERIVQNVKSNRADKRSILEGKNFIENIKEELNEYEKDIKNIEEQIRDEKVDKLNIGDDVLIVSKDIKGTIVSKSNKDDEFIVQAGILKLPVNIADLKKIGSNNKEIVKPVVSFKPSSTSLTIDLRGCRCDEAEKRLDRFIEQSIASGIYTIRIIHGMGTGALKNFIHNYLKSSSFIVSFDYEEDMNIGKNYGVTIAKLK
ncbi:MAG TPA: endonuclease MutS2 [Spirochaetota bacterium]|nr:endonuclease MutS2 [Spirochaetota bacterium]HOL57155.1 endonuclease MutS2 [Spirochaetota bacterium]HPP04748.1 endonuclease MutS2 [Spirochaetota bacterium]